MIRWMRSVCCLFLLAGFGAEAATTAHLMPLPVPIPGASAFLLEAEPTPAPAATDADGSPVFGGQVLDHDADRINISGGVLVVANTRHRTTTVTLRWQLDERIKPGRYQLWTAFTQGGHSGQRFLVALGPTAEALTRRAEFSQAARSWETVWRNAPELVTVYPDDRVVQITVTGANSQQKNLDAFWWVREEELPRGLTTAGAQLRRQVLAAYQPAATGRRLDVLEGAAASETDPVFAYLLKRKEQWQAHVTVRVWSGKQAAELARRTGIERLPALIAMNDRYVVRAVRQGRVGGWMLGRFLSRALGDGSAPGPFPRLPAIAADAPQPLRAGAPVAWLVPGAEDVRDQTHPRSAINAGIWAGPAGLSLWGLDYEPELQANPGDRCATAQFDSLFLVRWRILPTNPDGVGVLEESLAQDFTWGRGVTYTEVYVYSERDQPARLHLRQTGIKTLAWLDGSPVTLVDDPGPTLSLGGASANHLATTGQGITDQGARIHVTMSGTEAQKMATVMLRRGWHRLVVKWIMQHRQGERWAFAARFTDPAGRPVENLRTQCQVPDVAPAQHAEAMRLVPQVTINAPFNLAQPGETIQVTVNPAAFDYEPAVPFVPFPATLVARVTDYDGREIARREFRQRFPEPATFELGTALAAGYYAVHLAVQDPHGHTLAVYPPDGFSVIGGTAAQAARKLTKKMAVTYYFMAGQYQDLFFPYMQRLGIFRNVGSAPLLGADSVQQTLGMWQAAHAQGLFLTADFWDKYSNVTQPDKEAMARAVAPYTRWFKSMNEIDIIPERPAPERMVERTRWEYEAAHQARPDAVYTGASLVRVGAEHERLADGELWFDRCLKLGLDQYQDAWDVHAYPQIPPVLEGTISNSPIETDLGVRAAYQRVGRTNTKPFWLGETGARAHGVDDRRWQADMVAKMVAWANSRADFHVIGFLVPWGDSRQQGLTSDIPVAHQPGEAALYTAGALIDGFDYERLSLGNDVQAARFGPTIMLWSTGADQEIELPLDEQDGPWVWVDVVGRVSPVHRGANGSARVHVTTSPIYVLTSANYQRSTGFPRQ